MLNTICTTFLWKSIGLSPLLYKNMDLVLQEWIYGHEYRDDIYVCGRVLFLSLHPGCVSIIVQGLGVLVSTGLTFSTGGNEALVSRMGWRSVIIHVTILSWKLLVRDEMATQKHFHSL